MALILLWNPQSVFANEKEDTISKGVFIDTVEISGMTVTEAKEALRNHIQGLRSKSFALVIGNNTMVVTMADLDYKYEPNNYIKQAISLASLVI